MKSVLIIGMILLLFFQPDGICQKKRNEVKVQTDSVAVDSVEYELIILDSGFDSWLGTKPSMNFYSTQYYEMKNMLYVAEWNSRNQNPMHFGNLYESRIEYYPNIKYGLELNYKLYYYFKYFEETNHVKLIDDGR
jgi:hypothetical protein